MGSQASGPILLLNLGFPFLNGGREALDAFGPSGSDTYPAVSVEFGIYAMPAAAGVMVVGFITG